MSVIVATKLEPCCIEVRTEVYVYGELDIGVLIQRFGMMDSLGPRHHELTSSTPIGITSSGRDKYIYRETRSGRD
jgi:hypothetical protein